MAVDVVSLLVGWSAGWAIGRGDTRFMDLSTGIGMVAVGVVATVVCFSAARMYRPPLSGIRSGRLGRLLHCTGLAAMTVVVWQAVLSDVVPGLVLSSVATALVATMIARYSFDVWLVARRAHGDFRTTVVVARMSRVPWNLGGGPVVFRLLPPHLGRRV